MAASRINIVFERFCFFSVKKYYEKIQEKIHSRKIKFFLPYVCFFFLLLTLPFIFLLWPIIVVNLAIDFGFLNDVRLE